MRTCPECGVDWPLDRFMERSNLCFKCRIQGIGFSYGAGGSDGKDFFHNDTVAAYQKRTIAEAAANGYEAVPAWTKTSYAPPQTALPKLEKAVKAATSGT